MGRTLVKPDVNTSPGKKRLFAAPLGRIEAPMASTFQAFDPDRHITRAAAAHHAGVNPRTLRKWQDRHGLQAIRFNCRLVGYERRAFELLLLSLPVRRPAVAPLGAITPAEGAPDPVRYITRTEASRRCGVVARTLRRWEETRGLIPIHFKRGNLVCYDRQQFEFIAQDYAPNRPSQPTGIIQFSRV